MRCKVVGIKKLVIPRYELCLFIKLRQIIAIYIVYIYKYIVIWHNKIQNYSRIFLNYIYLTAKWRLHSTFSLRDLYSE